MNVTGFVKNWKVIDLLELCKEISNGDRSHPVYKEQQYQIVERAKGNDRANLEWVADNEATPIINEFLLKNGFDKSEKVLFWVSW